MLWLQHKNFLKIGRVQTQLTKAQWIFVNTLAMNDQIAEPSKGWEIFDFSCATFVIIVVLNILFVYIVDDCGKLSGLLLLFCHFQIIQIAITYSSIQFWPFYVCCTWWYATLLHTYKPSSSSIKNWAIWLKNLSLW